MSRRDAQEYVYRNLHRECWSVRLRGRVVAHEQDVWIHTAQFKVSEPGRQRVLREKRKNVHAFVSGRRTIASRPWSSATDLYGKPVCVKYNPYKSGHFYTEIELPEVAIGGYEIVGALSGLRFVNHAAFVQLKADGTVWAWAVS